MALRPFHYEPPFSRNIAMVPPRYARFHWDPVAEMDRALAQLDHFFDDQRNIQVFPILIIHFNNQSITVPRQRRPSED